MATVKYKDANGNWQIINKQVVDSELSNVSVNPVQNKIIKEAIDNKQDKLTFDETVVQDSENPVTSGAVYNAMNELGAGLEYHIESVVTDLSNVLNNKQEQLTFDASPTEGSTNPVTSGGIYNALSNISSSGGTVSEKYELVESIKVSEEAVVQRTYPNRYKKMIIRAICSEKLPKFRLTGGAWYSEFYGISDYVKSKVLYIGEIIVPGAVSEQRCLAGDNGGNATECHTIIDRMFEGDYFDGFKTDNACYVGTTIQVYGVRDYEN